MGTFILVVLILAALAVIAVVVARKLPQLSSMNVEQSPKERLKQLKQHIVATRLARKAREIEKKIFAPKMRQRIRYLMKESYRALKVLEDKYRTQTAESKMKMLLTRGRGNAIDDPELAEQCFLDVLTLDPHNLAAYEGLSQIYLARKSFNEAKEVLEFLVKLNPALAGRYLFDLGTSILEAGDAKGARHYAMQALTFEPASPKYLDFLIELAILEGHKNEGAKYLDKLREVNPENAKLEDFENRLKEV